MGCGFDREIIQRYADNSIDPLEFIFLKEHLNYCSECRKELDLVMTLENELNSIFDEDPDVKNLNLMIIKLVDDCMSELNRREKLKYALNRSIQIGNGIMGNSLRFIEHMPGSRLLGRSIKRTASAAGNLLVSIVKNEVGKLTANMR